VGAAVTTTAGDPLGTITSVSGTVALAPLLRKVAPPADVLVDGQPAAVVALPMR
jgi:hypothetical protein